MENLTIDKKNGNIGFNEAQHKYIDLTDPSIKFTSVTTMIEKFAQPFDKDFWSAYKALEKLLDADSWKLEKKTLLSTKKFDPVILELHDITENDFNKAQQDILDAWDAENRRSCERGTKIHADLENSFYNKKKDISLSKYQIGGKFECQKDRTSLDLENAVYPEYLIHWDSPSGKLHIAGQIDLLVKKGNSITIGDWKGLPLDTEIPTLEGWSTIAELKEGDTIFDKNGKPTKIIHKSKIHLNPCYKITFDNGDSIIADHEHRWLVSFKAPKHCSGYKEQIMTTEELSKYLETIQDKTSYNIPRILNPKPLQLKEVVLPIDPYVLGCWLGDNEVTNDILEEKLRRGYAPEKDISPELKELNLINNKHIPNIYQRASYEQRLDLLRGLMDTNGYYNTKSKIFVMKTLQDRLHNDFIKLLSSLGINSVESDKILKEKECHQYSVNFSTLGLNPFLVKNQELLYPSKDSCTYRKIVRVELTKTVQTQCLEVDSPTHTFLCTNKMIVTHNTNKKIETKSFYNAKTKSSVKMQFPLNNLDDTNYWHYCLQLSTYAYIIESYNPDFTIEDLVLVHFDHEDNMTVYHLPYLRKEVERMLAFYEKENVLSERRLKNKRIEY